MTEKVFYFKHPTLSRVVKTNSDKPPREPKQGTIKMFFKGEEITAEDVKDADGNITVPAAIAIHDKANALAERFGSEYVTTTYEYEKWKKSDKAEFDKSEQIDLEKILKGEDKSTNGNGNTK